MSGLHKAAVHELALKRLKGATLNDIASDIVLVATAVREMRKSRLTDDTVHLLIQEAVGHVNGKKISLKIIKLVMDGAASLDEKHLKGKT